MSTKYAGMICPTDPTHGPLIWVDEKLRCVAQPHDGRPKSHPLGAEPPTRSVFTLEEVLGPKATPVPAPKPTRQRAEKPADQPLPEGLRRCTGSERFGIPAHDAPVAEFPLQRSRPDGLGRMCQIHWKQYTTALRAGPG